MGDPEGCRLPASATRNGPLKRSRAVGVVLGGVLVVLFVYRAPFGLFAFVVAAATALAGWEFARLWDARLARSGRVVRPWRVESLAVALACVGPACVALVLLRHWATGLAALAIVATWARDLGAFAVGRVLRGPVLWPEANAAKTLPGAVGGLAGCGAAIASLVGLGAVAVRPLDAVALTVLVGVAGQLGDLLESRLKRSAAWRHSGRLLGAQGGLLDCIDGLLLTAPVTAIYWLLSPR